MLEMAKKTILFGIGALSFSKEKGEKLVKDLVEKGKLSQEEALILVAGIMQKGAEEKEALKNLLQMELQKTQLEARLQKLEAKVELLSKSLE